jgi:hypothetical protein|tara:strand:- start:3339 stop:3497 length:159 start_codon:yes stop_codon:yes gene_type:complete
MEKTKKVVKKAEPTKTALVRALEEKIGTDVGFLNSLERANKETIVRLAKLFS